MLYKFKSKAAADVIMLQANGRQMLEIIGKDPAGPGIVTAQQIPAAIAALEQAIAQQEAARAQSSGGAHEADADEDTPGQADSVALRQRAKPFIDLLRRSAHAGEDVVWGV